MTTQPNWDLSEDDQSHVTQIVDRAIAILRAQGISTNRLDMHMDLIATHNHACPLDLERLSAADDFNLMHDVLGINRHLDREALSLRRHFRPRFAAKDSAPQEVAA